MYDDLARADFSRARRRAFWQRVRNWFSGKTDALLPFDQVRAAIPIQGQSYRGLQSIPIDQIVGSIGRYHEFNRAFLPTQDRTADRWVKIGKAHYQQVSLPPIEVGRELQVRRAGAALNRPCPRNQHLEIVHASQQILHALQRPDTRRRS